MGKGEIARNEQFLLFPQCFQKACFSGASCGNGLKCHVQIVSIWTSLKNLLSGDGLIGDLQMRLIRIRHTFCHLLKDYIWMERGLTLYQVTNFRPSQTERGCRGQSQIL